MTAAPTRKADYRAILLLILALVPIVGALLGSVAYWRNGQHNIDQLTASNDPVEISYLTHTLLDDYQSAGIALRIASWPGSDDEAIAEAAARKDKALASLEQAEPNITRLSNRIAGEIGIDPSVFISMMTQLFDISRRSLTAQQAGEPVIRGLEDATAALSGSLAGRSFPAGESSDATLRIQRQLLYSLFGYHADASSSVRDVFEILEEPANATSAFLGTHNEIAADEDLLGTWDRVRVDQTLVAGQETKLLLGGRYETEPLATTLMDALPFARGDSDNSFEIERLQVGTNLLEIMDLLRADTDLMYAETNSRLAALDNEQRSRQRIVTALGALLSLLGVGLLALTATEVRHRRKVESDHRDALERLDSKAQTDPLTGAWNRRRFDRVLQERLDNQATDGPVLLAYVDLDRFKALNDVWGRTAGDQVLRIVARRLQNIKIGGHAPEVIRFGGDEFICFISHHGARHIDASEMGEQLLAAIRQPIVVDGEKHLMTATAGLAISDEKTTPDSLLLEADRSLMLGKRVQRGSTVTSDQTTAQSNRLVKLLPSALQNGEITCHYQPVFSIETGEMLHVEALSRWTMGDGENISPGTFVPLVEAFGMSNSLTRSVLRSISAVMSSDAVPDHVGFWLNVAPVELEEFDFADRLLNDIDALNLPPKRLAIEITETAAISDPTHFSEQVERLREVGIEIAIDDFGSGYSPLGYLQDLPIDVVKIDRSLIAHIDTHESNQQLLTGIIGMLQTQGRAIVAEGVERDEELDWLRARAVDMVQGYLTARPSAPADVEWPAAKINVDS